MNKTGNLRYKILFLLGIFILALAFSAAMPGAEAASVMAQPEASEKLAPGESYAESRFGHPPMKVDTGVSHGYASRAVEDMESSDEEGPNTPTSVSRRPAGLQFARGSSAAHEGARPPLSMSSQPLSEAIANTQTSKAAARMGVQEVALIASDLGYFPKTVFVSRDVPVRLFVTGSSKNTLCIMMDSFSVRKQVRSQKIEEITFTPNVPGKYRFYCPVNGMEGTMVVKEFASFGQGGGEYGANAPIEDSVGAHSAAPARRQPASPHQE